MGRDVLEQRCNDLEVQIAQKDQVIEQLRAENQQLGQIVSKTSEIITNKEGHHSL